MSIVLSDALSVQALRLDDRGAFELLVGTLLEPNVSSKWFGYSLEDTSGVATVMKVGIQKERSPVAFWGYRQSQEVSYNRLTLSSVLARLGGVVYTDFPTTTRHLFGDLLRVNELYDRSGTICNEEVLAETNLTLRVHGGDFLLVGEGPLLVKQLPKDLAKVVLVHTFFIYTNDDLSQTPHLTMLLDAVNEANSETLPRAIRPGDVTLTVPDIISDYDGINTRLDLVGDPHGTYFGRVTLDYHRINFSWIYRNDPLEIRGTQTPTMCTLLTDIREATGRYIDMSDLVEEHYPPMESGETHTLTIRIAPESLRYVGEITIDYTAE